MMDVALKTICEIQNYLKFTDSEVAAMMKMNLHDYRLIKSEKRKILLGSIQELAYELGLHKLNLLEGDVDYQTLKDHVRGNKLAIPIKYSSVKGSKVRTIKKVLTPLQSFYGEKFTQNVLNRFQIKEQVLEDDNCGVNVLLIHDFFSFLKNEWAVTDDMFFLIGQNSHCRMKDRPLFEYFDGTSSHKKMHEKLFEEFTPYYEKNYNYKILKINNQSAFVECKAKPERQEELKQKIISNRESCYYREGVISGLATLIGFKHSGVNSIKSVHQGDQSTVYHIEFCNIRSNEERFLH